MLLPVNKFLIILLSGIINGQISVPFFMNTFTHKGIKTFRCFPVTCHHLIAKIAAAKYYGVSYKPALSVNHAQFIFAFINNNIVGGLRKSFSVKGCNNNKQQDKAGNAWQLFHRRINFFLSKTKPAGVEFFKAMEKRFL